MRKKGKKKGWEESENGKGTTTKTPKLLTELGLAAGCSPAYKLVFLPHCLLSALSVLHIVLPQGFLPQGLRNTAGRTDKCLL